MRREKRERCGEGADVGGRRPYTSPFMLIGTAEMWVGITYLDRVREFG